jgi:hypothetical protein
MKTFEIGNINSYFSLFFFLVNGLLLNALLASGTAFSSFFILKALWYLLLLISLGIGCIVGVSRLVQDGHEGDFLHLNRYYDICVAHRLNFGGV